MRTAVFAALALALLAAPADARPRHHHRHHHHRVHAASAQPIAGRPAPCARIPWCGCWLRLRHRLSDVSLNLAARWRRVGSPADACRPGLIAVWPHHVGEVTACLGGGMIRMISGNDGNAVRDRVRPLRGAVLREI